MGHLFANRVAVAVATTGTGTVTLGAAIASNFVAPADVPGLADGDVVTYLLQDGANYEIGRGELGSSKTTLTRDDVEESMISGTLGTTKLTLSGSATLRVIASAGDFNDFLRKAGDGSNLTGTRVVLSAVRVYRVSGSPHTWSKPGGLHNVRTRLWGGGGGSAGGYGVQGSSGSGAGGDYVEKIIDADDLGSTETVTVGAGGSGASAETNNASAGGTSSFGSHASAAGGARGLYTGADNASGGAAGSPASGDINIAGFAGSNGSGATAQVRGGSSPLGGAGGVGSITSAGPGASGLFPGAGAASGRGSANGGASGADGLVLLEEYVRI